MMPLAKSFNLNKIVIEFYLEDGTKKTLETKVLDREEAIIQYDEAVGKGSTAVISYK